ncbi:Crp/Fnr family transcriptional regulator [Granulicella rosea]|nr:Crp/Fnr family transcriptional regulator [Granulicella rosea]
MPIARAQFATRCESCEHRTLRLFCNLTPDALAAFGAIGTSASFPRGATLFREGDPGSAIHVLCSGQVKLSCTSPAGKVMILKIAGPGDLLGLSAVVGGQPYEVTAESLEPVEVRHIGRADFLAFLAEYGEASMHAAQTMQTEYRSAFLDARLLALSSSASGRLAHVLLRWADGVTCGKEALRFNMALTHEELGSMANLSRETVTRLLGRFQKEKLLAIRGVKVEILAPEKLRELAEA